jgi:hypothetical protein
MSREFLKIKDEEYPEFIREFRLNYPELKKTVQLQRGKITFGARRSILKFLKFSKYPKNADKYMPLEVIAEKQKQYAEQCIGFWRQKWDGNLFFNIYCLN